MLGISWKKAILDETNCMEAQEQITFHRKAMVHKKPQINKLRYHEGHSLKNKRRIPNYLVMSLLTRREKVQ